MKKSKIRYRLQIQDRDGNTIKEETMLGSFMEVNSRRRALSMKYYKVRLFAKAGKFTAQQ